MAGTTNLIPWNPTGANQETDAQYLADSQRAGGAVDPEFFDATLANKAFYQWSTYLTALFQAFAAKGFTTSDSNLNTLASVCANFLTTADMEPAVLNVAYTASVTLDASLADGFYIQSMTGNLSITAITGMTPGQIVAMYYQQDGVGGRTVTFPAVFVGAQQPDPAANAVSSQLFGYDSNTAQLRALTPLISDNGAWFPAAVTVAGALTAPTVAPSDNTTNVVTSAWSKYGLSFSLGVNGYIKLPNWLSGLMLQWGTSSALVGGDVGTVAVSFPLAFPNNCFNIQAIPDNKGSNGWAVVTLYAISRNTTGFTLAWDMANPSASINQTVHGMWFAVGN
jgi:hypothetical protein